MPYRIVSTIRQSREDSQQIRDRKLINYQVCNNKSDRKIMSKNISCILTVALVSAAVFTSCNDNQPEQEMFKFPIELFPIEISNISDVRFFIGGKEVFDTALCKSFMRSEWIKMLDGRQRYNFFDEDDYMNNYYIPQNITFIAQDTTIIDYLRFVVERKNSFFVFHPYNYQYSTNKASDYFRENFNLQQTANGNYTDFGYDIVNLRYNRSVTDTPLWEYNGSIVFGIAGRFNGKIDCDYVVLSMHPTDTFVYQQYQVRYQVFKQD